LTRDAVAAGAEGETSDPAVMALEGVGGGGAVEGPEPDGAICAGRGDAVAAGAEGGIDGSSLNFQNFYGPIGIGDVQ
jgi:hypothetical protein